MNRLLVKVVFTISFLIFIFSALAKVLHAENADTYLWIGLILSFLCLGYVVYSIFLSKKMETSQKLLWTIALYLIGWPVMLIYVFVADRKRKDNDGIRTT